MEVKESTKNFDLQSPPQQKNLRAAKSLFLSLRSFALSLFSALAIISLFTTSASASVLKATMDTAYFTVRYDPTDKFLATNTVETANREFVRISKALGYKIERNRPIPLWIYRTHYSFIQEVGLDDKFTVGTARTGDERICIDASGAFVTMKQVLAHELTHAVIFRILKNHVSELPLWVNEGLAKYESEYYPDADNELISDNAARNRLIPLSSLKTTFPKNNINLAYAQSASAMRYLIKDRGKDAPKTLLAELASSGSFDKAFAQTAGKSESEFVAAWNKSISRQFAMNIIWHVASAIAGASMAILVIIAFIIRRRRMAQAAREWDWEEFEASMERQLREWPHR